MSNNTIHGLPLAIAEIKKNSAAIEAIMRGLFPPGTNLWELTDNELYEALAGKLNGLQIQINDLQNSVEKSIPVYQRFNFYDPTTMFDLADIVNEGAPITLTYETLPQKRDIDFTVTGKQIDWINPADTSLLGIVEVVYYKL